MVPGRRNCPEPRRADSTRGVSEEEPGGLSAGTSAEEGAVGMGKKSEVGGLVGRQVPLNDDQHCGDLGECEV